MTVRKKEDVVAFASFANVEASGAFEIRCGFGSNLQAKCRSEWAAYIDSWVFLGVTRREVVHELRTGEPREDRLPERDLDVGDVRSREDILAGDGRDLRVRVLGIMMPTQR